ncbi:hypothetical protein BTS2_0434 [Bacillus sp. TS-2]|nr:hypothetical protein BTS2_0434 [Bacillus sp. TS-2]
MKETKQTPQERREKLRQEELKGNPTGNLGDAFNRSQFGSLSDLVGSLGWKRFGILILVIIVLMVFAYFFI